MHHPPSARGALRHALPLFCHPCPVTCLTPLLPKIPCDLPPFCLRCSVTCVSPPPSAKDTLRHALPPGCPVTCITPLLPKTPCEIHYPKPKSTHNRIRAHKVARRHRDNGNNESSTPIAMHNASLPEPRDLPKLRLAVDAVALEHPEEERAAITAHPHGLRVGIRPADARGHNCANICMARN